MDVLDCFDVGGLQTLGALGHLELHLLALGEGAVSLSLDGGVVAEHVLAPAVLRDEAKALRIVEPLHRTTRHLRASFCSRRGTISRGPERPADADRPAN